MMRWLAIASLAVTGVVQYILHYNTPAWGELDVVFGPGDGQQYAVPTLVIQVALIGAMVLPWIGRIGRMVALAWTALLGTLYGVVGVMSLIHHPIIALVFALFAAGYGAAVLGLLGHAALPLPREPQRRQ